MYDTRDLTIANNVFILKQSIFLNSDCSNPIIPTCEINAPEAPLPCQEMFSSVAIFKNDRGLNLQGGNNIFPIFPNARIFVYKSLCRWS